MKKKINYKKDAIQFFGQEIYNDWKNKGWSNKKIWAASQPIDDFKKILAEEVGCKIDPKTGDLKRDKYGSILIYKKNK